MIKLPSIHPVADLREVWKRLAAKVHSSKPKPHVTSYGHDRTIHQTTYVDVEVDVNGSVVAVWFRCMPLPFRAHSVGEQRAKEMRWMYKGHSEPKLLAVEVDFGEQR